MSDTLGDAIKRFKCRIGLHDWEFLYYGDRLGMEYGFGLHECRRCGKREERFKLIPQIA